LLMMLAALPALLTFFIRVFVPESKRWEQERDQGATSYWANRDLFGVLIGSVAACGMIFLWVPSGDTAGGNILGLSFLWQVVGTLVGLAVIVVGYTYPVALYLKRAALANPSKAATWGPTLKRMLLTACLSSVALLGTWGTVQQAPTWAYELAATMRVPLPTVRSDTQIWLALGAIVGTIVAALVAEKLGRRLTYSFLCVGSMIVIPALFLLSTPADAWYVPVLFLCGAITASFYGWLPLYLPELFPTAIRATGQGFGFNFGRVIAAVGVLQLGNLKGALGSSGNVYSILASIYIVGLILVWFAPETKGKPLPQ
jgi:SHS family sialic acid transporter-like MFS transporter